MSSRYPASPISPSFYQIISTRSRAPTPDTATFGFDSSTSGSLLSPSASSFPYIHENHSSSSLSSLNPQSNNSNSNINNNNNNSNNKNKNTSTHSVVYNNSTSASNNVSLCPPNELPRYSIYNKNNNLSIVVEKPSDYESNTSPKDKISFIKRLFRNTITGGRVVFPRSPSSPTESKKWNRVRAYVLFAITTFGLVLLLQNFTLSSSLGLSSMFDFSSSSIKNLRQPPLISTDPWSVTYSPINKKGDCKRLREIERDLQEIQLAGIKRVSLHSPDCDILTALNSAPKLEINMGLYPYEYEPEEPAKDHHDEHGKPKYSKTVSKTRMQKLISSLNLQVQELAQWNQWHRIPLVVVGSSGVFEESYSRKELVTMLRHVRRILKGREHHHFKSSTSIHRGLGLDHINITTSEPVQSYISQSRYNAENVAIYREKQNKQISKIHETVTSYTKEKKKNIIDYAQLFGVISKRSTTSEDDNLAEVNSTESTNKINTPSIGKKLDLFEDDTYLQAAANPHDDDDLCSHVDVIGLVVQPFFNGAVSFPTAGKLVERDTKFARYLCSDQFIGVGNSNRDSSKTPKNSGVVEIDDKKSPEVVILEAGWPTQGKPLADSSRPGKAEQKEAVISLMNAKDPFTLKKIPVALYSWNDEEWREPGEMGVETHFGIRSLFYKN